MSQCIVCGHEAVVSNAMVHLIDETTSNIVNATVSLCEVHSRFEVFK